MIVILVAEAVAFAVFMFIVVTNFRQWLHKTPEPTKLEKRNDD